MPAIGDKMSLAAVVIGKNRVHSFDRMTKQCAAERFVRAFGVVFCWGEGGGVTVCHTFLNPLPGVPRFYRRRGDDRRAVFPLAGSRRFLCCFYP